SSTFLLRLAAYLCPLLVLLNLVLMALDVWAEMDKAFRLLVAVNLSYLACFTAVLCIYTARAYKNGVDRPVVIGEWTKSVLNSPAAGRDEAEHLRSRWTTNKTRNGYEPCESSLPLGN